jgi:hypothetical protein
MSAYADLVPTQQRIVDNLTSLIRSAAAKQAQLHNLIHAISNDPNSIAILQLIDADEVIPNSTQFAGSDDMTRAENETIYTDLKALMDTNDTAANRALWSKAAGINATSELE